MSNPTRLLKVEETGDFHSNQVKPAIRLKGKWLEAAGFPPDSLVRVTCQAPGVLVLQKFSLLSNTKQSVTV